MMCTKSVAIFVFAALIGASNASPASKLAANFQDHNSRLVARQLDDCDQPPKITPEYWREMKLDDYLRNYPNGNSLSLPLYVEQLHLGTNFDCGVQKHCSVGPFCKPVKGKDYYVLFATGQWNYYTNSLSSVLRSSSALVKHRVPQLIHDFCKIPAGDDDAHVISGMDLIRIFLGPISEGGTVNSSGVGNSTEPDYLAALTPLSTDLAQKLIAASTEKANGAAKPHPLSGPSTSTGNTTSHIDHRFVLPPVPNAPGQEDHRTTEEQAQEEANELLTSMNPLSLGSSESNTQLPSVHQEIYEHHIGHVNQEGSVPNEKEDRVDSEDGKGNLKAHPAKQMIQKRSLLGSGEPVLPLVYNSSATIELNIDNLSVQFEAMVDDSFTHKINAPISQDAGLYGALKDGRFLVKHVEPAKLRSDAKKVVDLLTINALLQAKTAMVVFRKSDCKVSEHLYGKPDSLSACVSDGTIAEIVLVSGDSVEKEIFNAHLIETKYGFRTSLIVDEARRCQLANEGKPEPPRPKKVNYGVCTVDLPICDLTEPRLAHMLNEGTSIAKICRQEVGLGI